MDALQLGVTALGPVITAALVILANSRKNAKEEGSLQTKITEGFATMNGSIGDIKGDVKELKHDFRETSEKLAERVNVTEIKVAEIQGQLYGHARGAAEAAILKVRGTNNRTEL